MSPLRAAEDFEQFGDFLALIFGIPAHACVLNEVGDVLGSPIASGILYPSFGVRLSSITAATKGSLSSAYVIANALMFGSVEI